MHTILGVTEPSVQGVKSLMALSAEDWISFSVIKTVFWNAPSAQEHQADLALGALVGDVCNASCDFGDTLVVHILFEPRST